MKTIKESLHQLTEYYCNFSDFRILTSIGSGATSDVYQAQHVSSGKVLCLKKFKKDTLSLEEQRAFVREAKILSKCRNFFLLPFYGVSVESPYVLITKFLKKGTLRDAIHSKNGSPFLTPSQKSIIATGICIGMQYLHEHNVIHRDLKSRNILLDGKLLPRICDMGISRAVNSEDNLLTQMVGTPTWMAPEVFMSNDYNNKVDVYSFGIILWEMLTGKTPFKGINNAQLMISICKDNERPIIPSGTPINFQNLICKCWHSDPNKRPSFQDIYKEFRSGRVEFPGTDHQIYDRFLKDFDSGVFKAQGKSNNPILSIKSNIPKKKNVSKPKEISINQQLLQESEFSVVSGIKEDEEEDYEGMRIADMVGIEKLIGGINNKKISASKFSGFLAPSDIENPQTISQDVINNTNHSLINNLDIEIPLPKSPYSHLILSKSALLSPKDFEHEYSREFLSPAVFIPPQPVVFDEHGKKVNIFLSMQAPSIKVRTTFGTTCADVLLDYKRPNFEHVLLKTMYNLNRANARDFFTVISELFYPPAPLSVSKRVLTHVYKLLTQFEKAIKPFVKSEAPKHLPYHISSLFCVCVKILICLFPFEPILLTKDCIESIFCMSHDFPNQVISFFSEIVLYSNIVCNFKEIFCRFLDYCEIFLELSCNESVCRVLYHILKNEETLRNEFKDRCLNIFCHCIFTEDYKGAISGFNCLIELYSNLPLLPSDIIEYHLRSPAYNCVISYLSKYVSFPITNNIVFNILSSCKSNETAQFVLSIIAENIEGCNYLLNHSIWMDEGFLPLDVSVRLFLLIFSQIEIIHRIPESDHFAVFLNRLSTSNNSIFIDMVSNILKKIPITDGLLERLSNHMFLTKYFSVSLLSTSIDLIVSSFSVITVFSIFRFFSEFFQFINLIPKLINEYKIDPDLIGRIILSISSTKDGLFAIKSCSDMLKDTLMVHDDLEFVHRSLGILDNQP